MRMIEVLAQPTLPATIAIMIYKIATVAVIFTALMIPHIATSLTSPVAAQDEQPEVFELDVIIDEPDQIATSTAPFELIQATATKYGWTGNQMASGKYPYIGAVAVSDRSIPFGTIIFIDGIKHIVEDRTALWVHQQHGMTVDIYSEDSHQSMLAFGRKSIMCNTVETQTWHCSTESKK